MGDMLEFGLNVFIGLAIGVGFIASIIIVGLLVAAFGLLAIYILGKKPYIHLVKKDD